MKLEVRRTISWLLGLAICVSLLIPGRTAVAHSGEWQWTRVCSWGICFYTIRWRVHQHGEEETEQEYQKCVGDAMDNYVRRVSAIDRSGKSEAEKAQEKVAARRKLRNDLEDCEIRRRTGE